MKGMKKGFWYPFPVNILNSYFNFLFKARFLSPDSLNLEVPYAPKILHSPKLLGSSFVSISLRYCLLSGNFYVISVLSLSILKFFWKFFLYVHWQLYCSIDFFSNVLPVKHFSYFFENIFFFSHMLLFKNLPFILHT